VSEERIVRLVEALSLVSERVGYAIAHGGTPAQIDALAQERSSVVRRLIVAWKDDAAEMRMLGYEDGRRAARP
jgi:hypothetical protein